jgi:hypothetical protein
MASDQHIAQPAPRTRVAAEAHGTAEAQLVGAHTSAPARAPQPGSASSQVGSSQVAGLEGCQQLQAALSPVVKGVLALSFEPTEDRQARFRRATAALVFVNQLQPIQEVRPLGVTPLLLHAGAAAEVDTLIQLRERSDYFNSPELQDPKVGPKVIEDVFTSLHRLRAYAAFIEDDCRM